MKILKKIKQSIVCSPKRSGCNSGALSMLSPITFHLQSHGENVRISTDGRFAKRTTSFCKAIVFTSRPLLLNERFSVQVASVSNAWSGSLRFGFSAVDPASLRGRLPRYMCPDLTNNRGFCAKALSDLDTRMGSIVTFWLDERGRVMYEIDGQSRGVFLHIEPAHLNTPLWAMVDVYGLVTSLKILHPSKQSSSISGLCMSTSALNLSGRSDSVPLPAPSLPAMSAFQRGASLRSIQFSDVTGANVRLLDNRTVACRKSLTSAQGYVFSARPLAVNEQLIVQVLRVDALYAGSLAFGLTTCSPASLRDATLPVDSHRLLDRPEYWVVIKDVLATAQPGDELAFSITESNQVQLAKNNLPPVTLLHVDATQRFYAFFDLFGRTTALRVLGTRRLAQSLTDNNLHNHFAELQQDNCSSAKQCSPPLRKKINSLPMAACGEEAPRKREDQESNECTVCFEKSINSVLYQCGHMCMCYDCAMKQWQGVGGGQCPICRAYICDVIRTYWS